MGENKLEREWLRGLAQTFLPKALGRKIRPKPLGYSGQSLPTELSRDIGAYLVEVFTPLGAICTTERAKMESQGHVTGHGMGVVHTQSCKIVNQTNRNRSYL